MQPPRSRIWLRRSLEWLLCLIIIPVLLLAAVEGGLRLAGYGKDVSPFLRKQFDGQTVYVRNDAYIQQFFTYRIPAEQWHKANFAVSENKPPGTYRVFVIGSSAARGWPSYECSFSRFLHAMLQAQYPNTHFEMYNCSFEGTNSHVMRGIAKACSAFKPDLFVVYMGNNEFHGPFGLVMNYQNIGAIRGICDIRLRIWLNRFRIYQTIAGRYPPRLTTQQVLKFPTVRMHATPDEAETIYANYERNLHDICDVASRAGAKVILSTVGANLRHWTPTGITHEPPLAPEVKAQWDAYYEAGLRLQAKGAFSEALAEYAKAAALDQGHAQFQFHWAECFLHAGDFENARQCFIQALDLDDCNWVRAKTPINEVVRRVAAKRADDGVVLADVAGWLEERSPHRITGLEFFIDGCHFNLDGSYEVARAIFDVMPACLPASLRAQAPEHAEPLSLTECKSRLGIRDSTVIDTYRRVIETDQRLGVEALDVLKEKVAALERNAVPVANEDVHTLFARAAQVFPQDFIVRREHAQLLFWSADKEVCISEARRLVEDFPGYRDALRLLVEALANAGHFEDALARFEELTRLYPDDADLIAAWGQTMLKQGNAEEALEVARRGTAG